VTITDTLRTHTTLLTVPEAAKLISWDRLTLYKAIKARRFPVVRLGPASIRIDPSRLADWIDQRTA
jgi:excisionase family DNA binding protein